MTSFSVIGSLRVTNYTALCAGLLFLTYFMASSICFAETKIKSIGSSVAGTFLAGRFAQSTRDLPRAASYFSAVLKQVPNNKDILRRAFILGLMDGRVEVSRALAARTLQTEPKAQIASVVLLITAAKEGRWGDLLSRAKNLESSGLFAFLLPPIRSWAYVALGKEKEALKALAPLKKNKATDAMFALHAGLILEQAGKLAQAELNLKKAFENGGVTSFRLAELLGILYERQGKKDKALQVYSTFLAARPGSSMVNEAIRRIKKGQRPPVIATSPQSGVAEALFEVASMLYNQKSLDTSLLIGQLALYLKPTFPIASILVSDIFIQDERFVAANKLLNSIQKNSIFYRTAQLRIAGNLDELGQKEDAIKLLEKLALEISSDPQPLFALGDILRGHKNWINAVKAYDRGFTRVRKMQPHHWRYLYTRGISLERSKSWPRAETDFLEALNLKPNQPDVLNYLGYSWIEKGMHLAKALNMVKDAVQLRPQSGYIIDSLGWAYYQMGQYSKAVPELERAVTLRSQDPIINDHLGDAYWRVGRKLEAGFQWNHALSLDPEPELKIELTQKLKKGLIDAVIDKRVVKPQKDGN